MCRHIRRVACDGEAGAAAYDPVDAIAFGFPDPLRTLAAAPETACAVPAFVCLASSFRFLFSSFASSFSSFGSTFCLSSHDSNSASHDNSTAAEGVTGVVFCCCDSTVACCFFVFSNCCCKKNDFFPLACSAAAAAAGFIFFFASFEAVFTAAAESGTESVGLLSFSGRLRRVRQWKTQLQRQLALSAGSAIAPASASQVFASWLAAYPRAEACHVGLLFLSPARAFSPLLHAVRDRPFSSKLAGRSCSAASRSARSCSSRTRCSRSFNALTAFAGFLATAALAAGLAASPEADVVASAFPFSFSFFLARFCCAFTQSGSNRWTMQQFLTWAVSF